MRVAVAARDTDKLQPLLEETGAAAFAADAADAQAVAGLFDAVRQRLRRPGRGDLQRQRAGCAARWPT